MAKLLAIKCSLIILQLVSLSVASVIIIVYYNPWIKIIIDAENGDKFVDQFRGIEGEEIVIFIMSIATIIVSVLGILGAVRGQEHNHCLLNFYMTTLIIFLFVTFVALCGTIWEVINKLINRDSVLEENERLSRKIDSLSMNETKNSTTTYSTSQLYSNSWWYLTKSFLFIIISATIYATSIKLARRILDSDDHYLEADDDSGRHFNINNDNDDNNTKDSSFTRV
jgi:hypothetical protein